MDFRCQLTQARVYAVKVVCYEMAFVLHVGCRRVPAAEPTPDDRQQLGQTGR